MKNLKTNEIIIEFDINMYSILIVKLLNFLKLKYYINNKIDKRTKSDVMAF